MTQVTAFTSALPCLNSSNEKETQLSKIARTTALAIGLISVMAGLLAIANVAGLNQIGHLGVQALIAGGGLTVLIAAAIKRVEKGDRRHLELWKIITDHATQDEIQGSWISHWNELIDATRAINHSDYETAFAVIASYETARYSTSILPLSVHLLQADEEPLEERQIQLAGKALAHFFKNYRAGFLPDRDDDRYLATLHAETDQRAALGNVLRSLEVSFIRDYLTILNQPVDRLEESATAFGTSDAERRVIEIALGNLRN